MDTENDGIKPEIDEEEPYIISMYGPRVKRGHWVIDYKQSDGRKRTKTFKTEIEALGWKHQKNPATPKGPVDGAPVRRTCEEFDGTLGWYMRVLGSITREVYLHGDASRRSDLKSIASAGIAAKHLFDNTKLEKQVKDLEDSANEISRARQYGIRALG